MDWMPQTIREGLLTILFISGPLVILAAVLGLVIGVIQAATQVQEQTLGSAVKIIGLFITLIIFGFYMFSYLSKYTSDSLQRAFKLVPSLGSYVKPRRNFLTVKPESQQLDIPRPPGELTEMNIPKPGGTKLADGEINAPEVVGTNQSQTGLDKLGKPSRQIKTENPNLKKQELNVARQPAPTAPAQPVKQAAPAQPVRQAAPAQPVRQAAPAQPVKQAAPAQPVRQAAPAQPVRQAAPAQPVRQAAPAQPVRQAAPAQPVRQAAPAQPAPQVQVAPEQPAPAPAQPPRRSLDDAINRLKNNFNQPAGAQ